MASDEGPCDNLSLARSGQEVKLKNSFISLCSCYLYHDNRKEMNITTMMHN